MKNLQRETEQELNRLRRLNRELSDANEALNREVSVQREKLNRRALDFQLMVDSIPVQVAVTSPTGEVETLNRPTLDYFGLSLDELKGWKSSDVVHPDDLERTVAAQTEAHVAGQSYNVESRHRRADGEYRRFNVLGLPLRDTGGQILCWFHMLIDIEDRKRAEDALRARERDAQSMIDGMPVGAAIAGPTGDLELVNQHMIDYFGRSLEELRTWMTRGEQTHPDDFERVVAGVRHSLATGQPRANEQRLRRHDGDYRWFQVRAVPARDAEGSIFRWYIVYVDIDDRKRAEAELRRAYDSFADAQRVSHTGSFITDIVADDHNWSDEAYRIFEFGPKSQVSVARIRDIVHPDDLDVFDAVIASGTSGQDVNFIFRVITASGALKHIRGLAHVVEEIAGRPLFVGALQDVTDSKRTEEALAASERNLQMIVDTIPALVWSANAEGSAEFLSQHYLEFVGLSAEQLRGWGWATAAHPDDVGELQKTWTRILASGQPGEAEARLRRFDGVYRTLLFRVNPLRNATGEIVKWYGVNTDIEDRKQAEEAVRSNEHKLSLILNTIPATIHMLATDGTVQYVNQSALDYFGLTHNDVGKADYRARIFHPDDLASTEANRLAALKRPLPFELELRVRGANGDYRWFLLRYSPLLDDHGDPERWYAVAFDIDDLKRTEADLKQTNDFFVEAQRLGRTGSFITDMDGDEHLWSEEARRIWGFGPSEKLSVGEIRARIHPDDLEGFDASAAQSIRGAKSVTHDFRVVVGGVNRHLRLAAHAQKRHDHRSFAGALQDVTDQKLSEAALDRARSELAHAARAMSLGVLTASIAHEVNQPLSGIVTNANTCLRMLDGTPPNVEGARDTARRTIRDGKRASEVISRLRTLFSNKDSAVEEVDLNAAAREVIALSSHELQRHAISLTTDFDAGIPHINADRVQIQQVIINLLLNASAAVRAVEKGARRIRIETTRDGDDAVKLSVQDNGVGLPEDHAARLFEPFFTTKPEGMGIGLSVSRSIIDRHQGRLSAANNTGAGATFSFSIPCAEPKAPPDANTTRTKIA